LILCDEEDFLLDQGGFGRLTHSHSGGLIATVGATDPIDEQFDAVVGVRVDASGYAANSWSFDLVPTPELASEPIFFTSIENSNGFYFDTGWDHTVKGNTIHIFFDPNIPLEAGSRFVSVYAYLANVNDTPFQGVFSNFLVDGVAPVANTHNFQ